LKNAQAQEKRKKSTEGDPWSLLKAAQRFVNQDTNTDLISREGTEKLKARDDGEICGSKGAKQRQHQSKNIDRHVMLDLVPEGGAEGL
jgi:hypothetical protein